MTEGTNSKSKEIDPLITRGCVIQLGPRSWEPEFDGDLREWKSTYLYPPRLDLSVEEYDRWALDTVSNWQIKHPELTQKFYFDKIIYWYVPNAHNVEVKRDRKWFNHIFPI